MDERARTPYAMMAPAPHNAATKPSATTSDMLRMVAQDALLIAGEIVVQLLDAAHIELRLAVVREQAVDLLFDVGQLRVAQAGERANPGDGAVKPAYPQDSSGTWCPAGINAMPPNSESRNGEPL